MNIEPELWIGALVLTLLTVVFTGPGLWSENWDFRNLFGKKPPQDPPSPPNPPTSGQS